MTILTYNQQELALGAKNYIIINLTQIHGFLTRIAQTKGRLIYLRTHLEDSATCITQSFNFYLLPIQTLTLGLLAHMSQKLQCSTIALLLIVSSSWSSYDSCLITKCMHLEAWEKKIREGAPLLERRRRESQSWNLERETTWVYEDSGSKHLCIPHWCNYQSALRLNRVYANTDDLTCT